MDVVKFTSGSTVLVLIMVTGCAKYISSTMADQVKVCGKQYQYQETIVTVEKSPQWVISSSHGCPEPVPLSPQPQSKAITKGDPFVPPRQALAPVVTALQGLPVFSAAVSSGAAPGPVRLPGVPQAVKPGDTPIAMPTICKTDPKLVREVIRFEPGSTEVVSEERTKLARFAALPVSYFQIDGYTDRSGSSRKNDALAMQRAQSVSAVLLQTIGKAVPSEVTGRAGCCFKDTSMETRRVEVTGVVQQLCPAMTVPIPRKEELAPAMDTKGGRPPMAK